MQTSSHRAVAGLLLAGLLAGSALAADWHVAGAVSRLSLKRDPDATVAAGVGHALLWFEGRTARDRLRLVTSDGAAVPHTILWGPDEGEPVKVLFDCSSGATVYFAYLSAKPEAGAGNWDPPAGLILETRKRGSGRPDSWAKAQGVWKDSTTVFGRSLVDQIHQGAHIHGPALNVASYYRGMFGAPRAGEYTFATVSVDASFLLVDGKLVAEWPGQHVLDEGRGGEFNGKITLTAGPHRIEYYNFRFGPGLLASAAWKPPGTSDFAIIPSDAFLPVQRFQTVLYETAAGQPQTPLFEWQVVGQNLLSDAELLDISFRVLSPRSMWRYEWLFDDGEVQKGQKVQHLFLRAGTVPVRLTATPDSGPPVTVERNVFVQPAWDELRQWRPGEFNKQVEELLSRDLGVARLADLLQIFRIADEVSSRGLLSAAGAACLARRSELLEEHADVFRRLAAHYRHPEVRMYGQAIECMRLVVDAAPEDSARRQTDTMELAALLLDCAGDIDGCAALMEGVDNQYFAKQSRRRELIYRGDLALAQGYPDKAHGLYAEAGVGRAGVPRETVVRRRALLETARDFVRRREFEAAADLVERIEWDTPLERLSTETGLIMVGVHIGRGEYPLALSRCKRLLHGADTDQNLAQVLYHLVEIHEALQQRDAAIETFKRLIEKHSYSEAAAHAVERWGKKLAPAE